MDECHCTVTLGQTTNRMFLANLCANVLGYAAVADDRVPLAIESGCRNGIADTHPEIQEVDNRLQDRRDNP